MKHGANIYKYATKIGCKSSEIIDFSSNINLYQPKIKTKPTNDMIVKYADSTYKKLKNTISKKYNIKSSNIQLFNGASSAIFELFKTLDAKKIYLYAPLYGEYEKAIKDKSKIIKIDRFKNLEKKVAKNSTVVFVNPSTPDGKYYYLENLFSMWKKQNCTIILDESFLEFESLKSLRAEIYNYDKLYIVQSFSKFYSCAGVRIGAIFSSKINLKNLQQSIWNLSSFDVEFLSSRLRDKKFYTKSKEIHFTRKKELKEILKDSKLFEEIYNSDSNFFLTKTAYAKKIFKHLLKHKILVRTAQSFDFLDDSYLRFAVKDKKSHELLKTALGEFKSE